jgi:hypothetical protein
MNIDKIKNVERLIIKEIIGPSGPAGRSCPVPGPLAGPDPLRGPKEVHQDTKELVSLNFNLIVNSDPEYKLNELLKLIYFDPTNYLIYTSIGSVYLAQGKLSEARSFFHLALIYNPNCVEALSELSILYGSVGTYESILFQEKVNAIILGHNPPLN